MNENTNAQGATVPMEDVQGIDQEIIDAVLADEGIDSEAEPTEQQETQQQASPEPESTPPAESKPPEGYVPLQALHEERRQRQQQAQQLAQMQQMIEQMQQQQAAQQSKAPAADEDPLSIMVRQQLEAVMPQLTKPVQELQQQWQEQQQAVAMQQRVEQSESAARMKYSDYDQVIEPIRQRVMSDPEFARTILSFPDPAEYAYMLALGQQAHMRTVTQGQAQANKLQQMAAMPRSQQIRGGGAPSEFQNLGDMVEQFEKLTPAQQEKLLRMTGV